MSLMAQYIQKRLSMPDLEKELLRLISKYNTLRNTYLLVYAAATEKMIPGTSLNQGDYYLIHDLLSKLKQHKKIDVYLETRGGSGETAEEIARLLHDNFETVSFVVSGEAKSAGTIIALSGNEILMTETASLGPIDAQIKIGRSVFSAYDYIEWIGEKKAEAEKTKTLNPFDAKVIAQITPGELQGVWHSLKFAEKLVVPWLMEYKFSQWTVTETQKKTVTKQMKERRALEIATKLTDHSLWKSHAKSIKIQDLENMQLKITHVDDDEELADTVYRIQTVCQMLFSNTNCFKIFATQDEKIFRNATPAGGAIKIPKGLPDVVEIKQRCTKCGIIHRLYAKFVPNQQIDKELQKSGLTPFPKDAKIKCQCGFELDLLGVKNQIEMDIGRKIITGKTKQNESRKAKNNNKRESSANVSEKSKGR